MKRGRNLLLMVLPALALGCTRHSLEPTAKTTLVPGFSVGLTLSNKAKEALLDAGETIVVAGYFSGHPKPGALKEYVSETNEVGLGHVEAEIHPGSVAKFERVPLKGDALDQTDGSPQLLINVYSGRKTSRDNLLDCGIYEGPLKAVEGQSIPIQCKLIRE